MAYYLDTTYDTSFYPSHSSTDDHSLASSFGIESSIYSSSSTHNPLASTSNDSPRSFPSFDPDSPFNSPIVPVKSIGRDGRLKTKLMGIGTEGGYLTSPLILGKSRMTPNAASSTGGGATPEISIESPASTAMMGGDSYSSMHEGGAMRSSSMSMGGSGMGMGISGVNELQGSLAMGDYGNPTSRSYGMPKARGRTPSECGYLAYPEPIPTTTLGRGKSNVGSATTTTATRKDSSGPGSATKFVEHRFPKSPPLAAYGQPPTTGRQPKKNLTVKTLNKAKSCSALSPSSQAQQAHEPLTPVSAHSANFFIPGVPYNSPVDMALQQAAEPGIMPFSFADLYNFGLAVDSVEEIDPRKSPYQFANELLGAENEGGGIGIGIGLGMGPSGYHDETDFNLLHSLPTPYLGSGFSSPSTSYLSDASPEIGFAYHSPGQLSSASMMSAPSMESAFSLPLPLPPPTPAGRQRCATYGVPSATSRTNQIEDVLDPSLFSPQSSAMQHRQLSSTSAYGPSTKFSYPSRYAQQPQQQHQYQAPPMSWANSVPPGSQQQHQQQQHIQSIDCNSPIDTSLLIPPYNDPTRAAANTFERNLEAFDDMYERYSQTSVYSTPGKRGRTTDDEDGGEFDDGSGEYVPGVQSPGASANGGEGGSAHKRLRTVASAPCLPTRRMRPGPKPKVTKSPQEQHQSVFSAILSPPPLPNFRRASSPYHSDGSPLLGGSDDEDEGARGSLPKEVIQSLYRGIPSHTANGVKVPKRYLCLMEGCDRTFPRKSAIESHIQTHLEDKPFVCPHYDCDASFVRQHDLRRHERIHSGNKPFPCPCGKGFARGDALARHRARGICEGSVVPRRM